MATNTELQLLKKILALVSPANKKKLIHMNWETCYSYCNFVTRWLLWGIAAVLLAFEQNGDNSEY